MNDVRVQVHQPGSCRVCGASIHGHFRSRGNAFGRCTQCGSLLRLLSRDQYLRLDVSYDSGLCVSANDPTRLRAYLRVEENKGWLRHRRLSRTSLITLEPHG